MNFVKKVKTFIVDPHTIFEGEVDQLGKPSGCGCMIKFYQKISGIKRKGTVINCFTILALRVLKLGFQNSLLSVRYSFI